MKPGVGGLITMPQLVESVHSMCVLEGQKDECWWAKTESHKFLGSVHARP